MARAARSLAVVICPCELTSVMSTAPPVPRPDHLSSMSTGLRLYLVLGSLATTFLLGAHAWAYRFLTDDAFISFRYARNLARGAGLVFNPGEAPVEGYTNFLWVLLLAGL